MSMNIEEEVVRINANDAIDESQTVLQLLSKSVQHTESGVIDVFRVLVCEDLSMIGSHAALYERLLHSALSRRFAVMYN